MHFSYLLVLAEITAVIPLRPEWRNKPQARGPIHPISANPPRREIHQKSYICKALTAQASIRARDDEHALGWRQHRYYRLSRTPRNSLEVTSALGANTFFSGLRVDWRWPGIPL